MIGYAFSHVPYACLCGKKLHCKYDIGWKVQDVFAQYDVGHPTFQYGKNCTPCRTRFFARSHSSLQLVFQWPLGPQDLGQKKIMLYFSKFAFWSNNWEIMERRRNFFNKPFKRFTDGQEDVNYKKDSFKTPCFDLTCVLSSILLDSMLGHIWQGRLISKCLLSICFWTSFLSFCL